MDTTQGTFARKWLPYCFAPMEHPERGKYIYLPLNRDYKPLGQDREKHYDYEDFSDNFVRFRQDPRMIPGAPWTAIHLDGWMWLYDDGPESRIDYGKRLQSVISRCTEAPIRRAHYVQAERLGHRAWVKEHFAATKSGADLGTVNARADIARNTAERTYMDSLKVRAIQVASGRF